jgi:hypothetical protein
MSDPHRRGNQAKMTGMAYTKERAEREAAMWNRKLERDGRDSRYEARLSRRGLWFPHLVEGPKDREQRETEFAERKAEREAERMRWKAQPLSYKLSVYVGTVLWPLGLLVLLAGGTISMSQNPEPEVVGGVSILWLPTMVLGFGLMWLGERLRERKR